MRQLRSKQFHRPARAANQSCCRLPASPSRFACSNHHRALCKYGVSWSLHVEREPVVGGLKVKYARSSSFYEQLCERVEAYFQTTGLSPRDQPRIYLKTAVLFLWLSASYVLLVFFAHSAWTAIPLAISLGLAGAGIGFNVQHDGGHGAYSNVNVINRMTAFTIDL